MILNKNLGSAASLIKKPEPAEPNDSFFFLYSPKNIILHSGEKPECMPLQQAPYRAYTDRIRCRQSSSGCR